MTQSPIQFNFSFGSGCEGVQIPWEGATGGNLLNFGLFLCFYIEIISVENRGCEMCYRSDVVECGDPPVLKTECGFLFRRNNCIKFWVCGIKNGAKIPKV